VLLEALMHVAVSRIRQALQPLQPGTGLFPLEHCDLLSEGENLEGGVAATTKEDANGAHERKDESEHKSKVSDARQPRPRASARQPQVVDYTGPKGYDHTQAIGFTR